MHRQSLFEARMSFCDRVQQHALIFDFYRRPFNFILPDNSSTYRSLLGSMLSIITIISLLTYATVKLVQLSLMEDFKINMIEKENSYGSDFTFTQEEGFNVAVAVTAYDSNPESIEDPSIGQLKFYLK